MIRWFLMFYVSISILMHVEVVIFLPQLNDSLRCKTHE